MWNIVWKCDITWKWEPIVVATEHPVKTFCKLWLVATGHPTKTVWKGVEHPTKTFNITRANMAEHPAWKMASCLLWFVSEDYHDPWFIFYELMSQYRERQKNQYIVGSKMEVSWPSLRRKFSQLKCVLWIKLRKSSSYTPRKSVGNSKK